MNYRIEKKDKIDIIVKKKSFSNDVGQNNEQQSTKPTGFFQWVSTVHTYIVENAYPHLDTRFDSVTKHFYLTLF